MANNCDLKFVPVHDEDAVHIVRRHGTRVLNAWHLNSFQELAKMIGVDNLGLECLFADLSLGPWRGHWLAREWGSQLDLPPPEAIQPILYTDLEGAIHYADTVGKLIDNESEGDRNFISAFQFARVLISKIQGQNIRNLFVVAPLENAFWGMENVHLLKLLSDAGFEYGFQVGLLLRLDASLEKLPTLPGFEILLQNHCADIKDRFAGFSMPGIINASILQDEGNSSQFHSTVQFDYLQLRNGKILISPNCRCRGELCLPMTMPDCEEHLQVYYQLQRYKQDVEFLQQQAGLRFAEGAYEIAFAILDGIHAELLSPLQAALVEVQKQNISIALMDFNRAAQGSLPEDSLPDVVKASLYQSKAWGLVMNNKAILAEPYFNLARKYFNSYEYPRLYLYLLNISALNKLRLNQIDEALALEKEIEGHLQQLSEPDWHLIYINCLNQARIYKKLGDYPQAELYYQRGFFINYQLRNESDLLYVNLCFAQLNNLQGNHKHAFVCWLRACIHWLSQPLPEALAPRVAQAALARPLSNKEADVEEISAKLSRELLDAAFKLGYDVSPYTRCIPFKRIAPSDQPTICISQAGWSLMLGNDKAAGLLPFSGSAYMRLNQLIVGMVAEWFPQIDFASIQCICTDHQCGIELPASPRELYWSCLKWDVQTLIYEGRVYPITNELNKPNAEHIGKYRVAASRAINYVKSDYDQWQVHFKRYLKPLKLTKDEQQCMEQLSQPMGLLRLSNALNLAMCDCVDLVNVMIEKRLLSIQ